MADNKGKKPPDFSSLSENLSQQQAKISALKELVRQSEQQHGKNTASAQEKVKNIAQRLSNIKSKTSRSKMHRSSSEISEDYSMSHIEEEEQETPNIPSASTSRSLRSETPGSDKISLLRKQTELNRLKMAERENKSKEIEQMVTQLKSKFESSQMSLERSVELGRSMGDLSLTNVVPSMLLQTQNRSFTISDVSHQQQSQSQPLNFENERMKFLEKRIRELEAELSNKENETDSDTVHKLESKILDLEETVREKECIIEARTKAVTLLSENLSKKKKDVVDSLEETKQEMFKMQETFLDAELTYKKEVAKLNRVITEKSDEIKNLNEKCEILEKSRYDLTLENSELKTKLEDVQDYSTKISELNKLNETLQKRISTLESQKYEFITEEEVVEAKTAEDNKKDDLSNVDELLKKLKDLEELLERRDKEIEKLQEDLQEKTIDVNVANANLAVLQEKLNASKPSLFSDDSTGMTEESQAELTKLKQQLDDSNKAMIKTKLKMKQMQKQIDSFQKGSSSDDQSRLIEENQILTQKIAELEEEKGSYQLQLVGKDKSDSELEDKFNVLEMTCQNQIQAIQLLEEQKSEISEDLTKARSEIEMMSSGSGVNEFKDKIKDLENKVRELEDKIFQLSDEKEEVCIKMNRYLNENMELLDKLEKLSKGSSAESIEMVNLLTAQEKLEIEQYQNEIVQKHDEVPVEVSQELNESLRSLRMESSELMEKIELFTIERREVLEKLDALNIENQVLHGNLEKLQEEKLALENQITSLTNDRDTFENLVVDLRAEKEEMSSKMAELSEHRTKLQEEINKLVKEELSSLSPQSSPSKIYEADQSDSPPKEVPAPSIDKEACEKLLKQLDTEIQNLNRNKDKNKTLKISKKLSDNAKNVHAMMTNLLIEYYKNVDECKQLKEDLEKVKILLNNVSSDKNNQEVLNLQKLLTESSEKLVAKSSECQELQEKLVDLQKSNEESYNLEILQLKSELENINEECSKKDDIIASLQDSIDALTNERDYCEKEVQSQMQLVSDLRTEFNQLCADVKINNQRLNEKSQELDQLQHEFDMRLKTSTNEVEILKTLVAEQKQLLIDAYQEHELDINQKLKEINEYQDQIKQMSSELEELRNLNVKHQESNADELRVEIKKLKDMLNECNRDIENHKDELLNKQETIDSLNTQIIDLYKAMEENSNKVIEKDDELQYIQEIVDSNRTEILKLDEKLAAADKTIHELREKLSSKSREMELLQQTSAPAHDPKADDRIKKLEAEVKALDSKNKEQLDKMKKYAANLKKKQAQCTELEERLASGDSVDKAAHNSVELNELKAKIIQYEEQLNNVKVENNKLTESLQKSSVQDELEDLRWKIDEYEDIVQSKSKEIDGLKVQLEQLSQKCDQMEEASYELQTQVQTLESEKIKHEANRALLERMSKELDEAKQKNEEMTQKLGDGDAKDEKKKMDKLKAAVVQLKHKLADKKKETEELTAELNNLKASQPASAIDSSNAQEIDSLKQQIKELDEMNEKILNETKKAYDNDIGLLKQKIDELELSNRQLAEDKQRKVSLEGQLETFEITNIELREKVARLEESIASLDADKNALIREKLTMDRELAEKDELIGNKLRETESDNRNLAETIKEMNVERNSLLQKLRSLELQLESANMRNGQQVAGLEQTNQQLQRQIEQLQQDFRKLQITHEQALALKHSEIDEMEAQFSSQLQRLETDKKSIQEALEKANDQIIDFQDEVVRLKDNVHSLENTRTDLEREMSWLKLQNDNYTQDQLENEQLRMQLMQCETELENLRTQNESMVSNHDAEVLILRQQISDLETMRSQVSQNQTDDQVMLQNENVKLKELLIEKENQIQQKMIQLQMATAFEAPVQAVNNPFANLAAQPPSSSNELKTLEDNLRQARDELEKMREAQMMSNMEMDVQSGKIQELLNENKKLHEKVHEMQSMMDNLIRTNVELEAVSEKQKDDIERKDKEINEIKTEMSALRDSSNQAAQSTDDDKFHILQSELIEKNHAIENLQKILQKYETSAPPAQPPQPLTTSMFFDDPQPSTTVSLFDDPFVDINRQPVVEEQITPKKAYLLYDSKNNVEAQTEECWLTEYNQNVNTIIILQNQIQSMEQKIMEQYVELEAQREKIGELETKLSKTRPEVPKEEQLIVPKKAYLCYDAEVQTSTEWMLEYTEKIEDLQNQIEVMKVESVPQPQQHASSLFASSQPDSAFEIEDGWSWGGGETSTPIVEPEITSVQVRQSLLSPRSDLEVKLAEQRDIVEKLELEKNSLNEELQNSRENSKKMMKKLKDYQQKIKDLETRRGSSVDSNDMNLFIQEELNSQVQRLEARLKEVMSEKEKEQLEKEAVLKKIEVLTNANDRMMDMKERQDSQMEMYQLKIKDLTQKIHSLEEWQDDSQKTVQQLESTANESSDELNEKISQLSEQLRDLQADHDELQALFDEEKRENKILEEKIAKINSEKLFDSTKDEEIKKLTHELEILRAQSVNSDHARITDLEKANAELTKEKSQMEHELQVLNDHVLASLEFEDRMKSTVLQLDAKDMEIQMLKSTLEKMQINDDNKQSETTSESSEEIEKLRHEKEELEASMKSSIDLLNAQWSQMVEQRGNEVAHSWKQHLEMREIEFAEIENELRSQLETKSGATVPESGVAPVSPASDIENETILKMKSIMESQEVEIVSLKEQLAIRSAEYAALSAKVDPYHQMSSSMSVSPAPSPDADKVPRSELDLALYMLHQRDMRLEEMTMELVRLLEERDQLQLRLSNAIRQLEDIKKKMNIEIAESSDQSTPEKSPPTVSVEDDQLKAKLSELNTVQHMRDKAIADDREKRFMEHITMFQRDVANIPPEAAARIVSGSDQSQQSPSSVLMNWILGKKPESP